MTLRAFLFLLTALVAAPAAAETIAIVDARILTAGPSGSIERGTILIRDGRIAAVGPNVRVPSEARIIEGQGGIATPGFIQAGSTLGAVEVSQVPASADRANQAQGLSAAFDISLGLNPDSILLPVARLAGITRAVVTPQQGGRPVGELAFAGQAALIDLGQRPDMVTRPRVAMVLEMGEAGAERSGGARGAAIVQLRAMLDDARHYARHRADYERGAGRPTRLSRLDLAALVPVAEGRMPLIVRADRASDLVEMIALAREEGLRLILDGAEEGWRVADDIARAGIPVILDPVANLPGSFSQLGATMENAARLHAAGVSLVLRTGAGVAHRARELRYGAGNAVAHGLPHDAALAALTINPARVFGVAGRIGSIEVGKEADIVLWSGDPFEPLSQPRAILVRGIEQPLASRQLELRDRYLPRAGSARTWR